MAEWRCNEATADVLRWPSQAVIWRIFMDSLPCGTESVSIAAVCRQRRARDRSGREASMPSQEHEA
jgi:hypothetical protein